MTTIKLSRAKQLVSHKKQELIQSTQIVIYIMTLHTVRPRSGGFVTMEDKAQRVGQNNNKTRVSFSKDTRWTPRSHRRPHTRASNREDGPSLDYTMTSSRLLWDQRPATANPASGRTAFLYQADPFLHALRSLPKPTCSAVQSYMAPCTQTLDDFGVPAKRALPSYYYNDNEQSKTRRGPRPTSMSLRRIASATSSKAGDQTSRAASTMEQSPLPSISESVNSFARAGNNFPILSLPESMMAKSVQFTPEEGADYLDHHNTGLLPGIQINDSGEGYRPTDQDLHGQHLLPGRINSASWAN